MCSLSSQIIRDECQSSHSVSENVSHVSGLIFKMKDGRWRMRISTDDLTGVDVSKPYSGTLDKERIYTIYSVGGIWY